VVTGKASLAVFSKIDEFFVVEIPPARKKMLIFSAPVPSIEI
jgi:hypothetical protein